MRGTAVIVVGLAWLAASASAAASAPELRVLSNRADLVSGGDALVEVAGADPAHVRVDVDGRDVTRSFGVGSTGRLQALLTGLKVGANVVTARLPDGSRAQITITNHPIGGPILSGNQVQPWFCHTEDYGLGKSIDAQCNVAPVVAYQYKNTDGEFNDYDPANPPPASSVASTTTDQDRTVPYIVRIERGVVDRGVYELAVLADPTKPWSPFDPSTQPGWNHKVYWTFGGDCTANHVQFNAVGANKDVVVSRGFLSGVSSGTNLGSDCNNIISAETLMMLKEHIVETYGPIRYTMSEGCSGGSMQQNWHTSNYPGLLDGIQPSCSFPDLWEIIQSSGDCHLLNHAFDAAPQTWTAEKQGAVAGHQSATSCRTLMQVGSDLWLDPENASACIGGITGVLTGTFNETPAATDALTEHPEWAYNAQANPKGERCDIHDFMEAIFGWRPRSAWGPVEQKIGEGFANRPFDNVGVQYGLQALLARMERANGHHENQIVWSGLHPLTGDDTANTDAIRLLDRWLARIEADKRDVPKEQKVIDSKPADAVDACWVNGRRVTDMATCRTAYPHYAGPRIAAGGPWTDDVVKCHLRPLDRDQYYGVTFSDDQWSRLKKAFPDGVCDYRKRSVGYQESIPWLTFADGPGGRPLGDAPRSTVRLPAGKCRARRTVAIRVRGLRRVSVRVHIAGRRVARRELSVRSRGGVLRVRKATKREIAIKIIGVNRLGAKVRRTHRMRPCRG